MSGISPRPFVCMPADVPPRGGGAPARLTRRMTGGGGAPLRRGRTEALSHNISHTRRSAKTPKSLPSLGLAPTGPPVYVAGCPRRGRSEEARTTKAVVERYPCVLSIGSFDFWAAGDDSPSLSKGCPLGHLEQSERHPLTPGPKDGQPAFSHTRAARRRCEWSKWRDIQERVFERFAH